MVVVAAAVLAAAVVVGPSVAVLLVVKDRNSVFFRRPETVFFTVFQTPSVFATVFF